MKSNIEAISDLLSEQIGCTQKERMEQYSKWNIYWNHIAKHQNINESNDITQKIISMLNAQEENSKECQTEPGLPARGTFREGFVQQITPPEA